MEQFGREEFVTERFRYKAGEHLSIIAPTGWGKTTLGYQLLGEAANMDLPAIVLSIKPRDDTVDEWNKRLEFRKVRTWPPASNLFKGKTDGWTLMPKHTFDPDTDDAMLYVQMRTAILDSYKKGNRILFADEVYGLSDLGLDRELITVWSRGRSQQTGLWAGTQKPTHVPLWMYSQAEHLFLGNDPDERAQKRFGEIGGVNPVMVREVVKHLPKWHYLYIKRDGPQMCIVGK